MRGEVMNNEYKNDYDGTPMLVLNYEGYMSADISVENDRVVIFSSYNSFEGDCNSIPIEDWEQVKEFVDSQINKFYGGK